MDQLAARLAHQAQLKRFDNLKEVLAEVSKRDCLVSFLRNAALFAMGRQKTDKQTLATSKDILGLLLDALIDNHCDTLQKREVLIAEMEVAIHLGREQYEKLYYGSLIEQGEKPQ